MQFIADASNTSTEMCKQNKQREFYSTHLKHKIYNSTNIAYVHDSKMNHIVFLEI